MSKSRQDIRVLVKRVGQEPTVEVISKGLESMQAMVGGMIEHVWDPALTKARIDMWANEEGKLNGLPVHLKLLDPEGITYDLICGDVFFSGAHHTGSSVSLSPKQVAVAEAWLRGHAL